MKPGNLSFCFSSARLSSRCHTWARIFATSISMLLLLSATAFGQLLGRPPEDGAKSVQAVVRAPPPFAGPCWLLITEYGRLEPTNLAQEFKIDGLKVVISFDTRHDLASTCMMGSIVTLTSIVREAT